MNETIEKLKNHGCDIDGAMERFLGDENFYLSLLTMALEDKGFDELGEALETGNYKRAFEIAHTLKGVLGNMGLTPIFNIAVEMVEPLRNGAGDYSDAYKRLIAEKDALVALVG